MGKKANRIKAANRKGETVFTQEQAIGNLKSKHRRDILELLATFNVQFQELDAEHALMVKNLKNSHKIESEALKERVDALIRKLDRRDLALARPKVALNADSLDI